MVLQAVDKDTKEVWGTQEVTEEVASSIIKGLFDDALRTLSHMIKDAFTSNSDAKYTVSIKVCVEGNGKEWTE